MELFFKKYKYTNGFFFKDIDYAKVIINEYDIVVLVPYFNYLGKYIVKSIKDDVDFVRYTTIKVDENNKNTLNQNSIDKKPSKLFLTPQDQKEEFQESLHKNLLYNSWYYRNFTAKNKLYNTSEFYIDISKTKSLLKLYQGNFKGIILKN